MDFLHLLKKEKCTMQIGGSDQWGNITAGIDLIHKSLGNDVIATGLTIPLVTKSDGTKFGKTESGAVWLSKEKTTPFNFFQFWLKVTDSDIEKLFKLFSFRSIEEINKILEEDKNKDKPIAQQLLAEEMTGIVHGKEELESVLRMTKALFDNDFDSLVLKDFESLEKDGMPSFFVETFKLIDVLLTTKLAKSKREARDLIKGGGIFVNGKKILISDFDEMNDFEIKDFKLKIFAVIQKGKRSFALIKAS